MTLYLYNSATRSKQLFEPQNPERITMYVCGPTVYNRVHIGNARPVVVFDTLFRLLKDCYPRVDYARNITDIDDKIMHLAATRGEDIKQVAQRYTEYYAEDMAALNNLTPTLVPLATEHVPEMLDMIARLIDKGYAYNSDGHVLFSVQKMDGYGALSGRSLEHMLAGARVEVADYKRYAGDFVLWKPSAEHEPGWPSPWGRGRPGWHIECSAMAEKHLGETVDIHGGGQDLLFPHHENERAQSCCAHDGKPLARYWMHNGFINIDGEKMSKSLGNFKLVSDLLTQYPGEVIRYVVLSAHYRSEQNFHVELLNAAWRSLDSLYGFLRTANDLDALAVDLKAAAGYKALLDDLNTPIALSELHRLARDMQQATGQRRQQLKYELLGVADLLGLLQQNPDDWFTRARSNDAMAADEIEAAISARQSAKASGDYGTADEIRKSLETRGVILEDSRQGTQWRRG